MAVMPRLSEKTRAQRRQHILTSAWTCFSRDGFHATSMDQVIASTGMSSSAVYRYFSSKEEIIHATAEEGVARVRGIFVALLDRDPVPPPGETLTLSSPNCAAGPTTPTTT
jgi:AcrR family transcriptional regulator